MPGVVESTAYGSPALKLNGKLMACIPTHRSAEPGSLAVCIDFDQRDELIAAEPDVYYVREHYVDYACVLVRLGKVHMDALRDLLGMAWTFANTKARRRARTSRRAPRAPSRRRRADS